MATPPQDECAPEAAGPEMLERVPTGISGLDTILGGGLMKAGIYIVAGRPGSGKTILANQMAYTHVASGGRAVYVTLLAETHGRMLALLQTLRFFDRAAIGTSLKYVNGFSAVESGGLASLLELLRRVVREQRASLLVLDGMVTASALARSEVDYKKFIHELQTWVGVIGCTVLFLTSAPPEAVQPEHTMVDGILELGTQRLGMRTMRQVVVSKFRGSAFIEGAHTYLITSEGWAVYPRYEGRGSVGPPGEADGARVSTGVPGLDELLTGGVAQGSMTLLLGSSGCGKTIAGMQFLCEGARKGEPGLHFGFFENPPTLLAKADRLRLGLREHVERGRLTLRWNSPAEGLLDRLAEELLSTVRQQRVKRLFIDGLVGFKAAAYAERCSAFFSVLSEELASLGVTTFITEETRELFVRQIEVPTEGVSAIFHNILFLRQAEAEAELVRLLAVMKTRDSGHSHAMHRFSIRDQGIVIEEPFLPGGQILRGEPTIKPRAKKLKTLLRKGLRRKTKR